MTQYISSAALAAQESARQNNGQFGSQLHGELAGGTNVLGAPVNLEKESADRSGSDRRFPEEMGFQGDVLAPAGYPRVAATSGRSEFEHLGGKVSVPLLDDIERAQRESGSDELVIPVEFKDRYGASEQREVTVRRHGNGYSLALPTGKVYSEADKSFLKAAGAGIAWACPSESKTPDEARRWANRMGLNASHWAGAASNLQHPDGGMAGYPAPLERVKFTELYMEGMRRWEANAAADSPRIRPGDNGYPQPAPFYADRTSNAFDYAVKIQPNGHQLAEEQKKQEVPVAPDTFRTGVFSDSRKERMKAATEAQRDRRAAEGEKPGFIAGLRLLGRSGR